MNKKSFSWLILLGTLFLYSCGDSGQQTLAPNPSIQSSVVVEKSGPLDFMGEGECYFDLAKPDLASIHLNNVAITSSGIVKASTEDNLSISISQSGNPVLFLVGEKVLDNRLTQFFFTNYERETTKSRLDEAFREWNDLNKRYFYIGDSASSWNKTLSHQLNEFINNGLRPGAGK